MRKLFSTLTAIVLSGFIVDAAMADVFDSVQSGDWNNGSNWTKVSGASVRTYPQATDTANLIDGDDMTLTQNENCDVLNVGVDSDLTIGIYTMTVTGSSGMAVSGSCAGSDGRVLLSGAGGTLVRSGGGTDDIDGRILLQTSTSKLQITSSNLVFSGVGDLEGFHNQAQIEIADDINFTNELCCNGGMHGAFEIRGLDNETPRDHGFINNGRVTADHANSGGGDADYQLTAYSGKFSGSGAYFVSVATAELEFRAGVVATSQAVSFFMSAAGTLDLQESVSTSGGVNFTAGLIQVAASKSFSATGAPDDPCD